MIHVRQFVVPIFLTLAVAALTGVILTTDWSTPKTPPAASPAGVAAAPIDLEPLTMAQDLAPLAVTPEEHEFAKEALQLADHEIDLAFAAALRTAADHTSSGDPKIRAIQDRLAKAQSLAAIDKQRIAELTAQAAKATGAKRDALDAQIALHKSTLELDQDQAADAQEDLKRFGGDPRAEIQKIQAEHEATQHATDEALHGSTAPAPSWQGLAGKIENAVRTSRKGTQIYEARRAMEERTISLIAQHDAAEKQVAQESKSLPELANRSVATPSLNASGDRSAELLTGAQHLAGGQQRLASLNKRISDSAQLAAIYRRWGTVARVEHRAALRGVLAGVLWIAVIIVFLHYLRMWLDCLGARFISDHRLQASLRTMVATAIDLVGLVTIAIMLFGQPSQFGTALGLIGAGLTVALKDFVVGFVGWFMLMGRRGIRVGDWVEIDGVRGEVTEIGLFRTIVLETGNWTESGHPTGRSVSFPNTFAIEGHFFNFTTEGQWLWDELRANLPAGRDFHAIAESIRKRASTVTADAAGRADKEWARAGTDAMRSFSAEPAVSLRPGPAGMEVWVRYVVGAAERNEIRARLFQELVAAIDETAPKPAP